MKKTRKGTECRNKTGLDIRGFGVLFLCFGLLLFLTTVVFCQGETIAHRGASSIAPENTIAAFTKAIDLGVGYIEVDVRFSKDDSVMVIHDETLDRTTSGSGKVNNFSYGQLKGLSAGYPKKFGTDFTNEKIPTLFEVLTFAKGKTKVCIDIKNSPENPIIELIEKMDMKDQVYLMSYNVEKLKRIKTIEPNIKTILIKNTLTSIDLEVAKEIGAFAVSTSYVSPVCLVEKAHDKGLGFWVGIISDPAKAESLLKQNVDAIFTDYPQLMTMGTKNEIIVSPNPFNESVTLQLIDPDNVREVFIINANGERVLGFKKPFHDPIIWEPGNNFTKGLYLVYVITNERIIFEKILYFD